MFDIGWSEIIVIGAIALVVIGPKDLPKFLRTAGQLTRRARQLANEFQNSIDDMVREAEIEEVKKQLKLDTFSVDETIGQALDPRGDLSKMSAEFEAGSPTAPSIPAYDPLSEPVPPMESTGDAPPMPEHSLDGDHPDRHGFDPAALLAAAQTPLYPPVHPPEPTPIHPTRTPPAP